MSRKLLVTLAAILTAGGLSGASAQADKPAVDLRSPIAADAARTVDSFHSALARNDVPAALVLLADDVVIFEGGRVERSKAEYASHHAAADAAYAAAAPARLLRRTATADGVVAWVTSESRATGVYKDKAIDQLTTESMILLKTSDGWRIAHIHWSSRAAPK
jgi:ketosteroid isomerase-like protein